MIDRVIPDARLLLKVPWLGRSNGVCEVLGANLSCSMPFPLMDQLQNDKARFLEALQAISLKKASSVFSTWLSTTGKEDASVTYGALGSRAGMIAYELRTRLSAKPGDRILLCYSSTPEFVVAVLACFRAGTSMQAFL